MIAEALPQPEPRSDWMRLHIETLFAAARAEGELLRFEIRAIHPTKKGPNGKALVNAQSFPLTAEGIAEGIEWAARLNAEEGFNVYVGANSRRLEAPPFGAAGAEDVFPLFDWHFADADSAEAVEALRGSPGPLHKMLVATGMTPHLRCHAYWQLEVPTRNPAAWCDVQKHLARAFGTDAVHDTPRILRLAGSISYPSQAKEAKGYRTEVVQIALYEDRDAVTPEALLAIPAPEAQAQGQIGPGVLNLGAAGHLNPLSLVDAIRRRENLHNNARDLIAHLVGIARSDWEIRTMLDELLRGRSDGGTLSKVPGMIQSARVKYNRPDPVISGLGAPPQRKRLELVAFKDIMLSKAPAYLVQGLIPLNGLIVVWGEPKCGKSFLAYDLAMAIARCCDYRGRRVRGGPVVYVACEGATGFRVRIAAYRLHHGIEEAMGDLPFYLVSDMLGLPTDQSALITAIRASLGPETPVLVVLDTLNRSLEGDENAPKDMTAYVRACDAIREAFDCAVIVVHHCGTEGKRPRGHTSLTGAADCQIAVRRKASGVIDAKVEYLKDGPEGDELHSRLEVVSLGHDEDGEPITSCVVVEAGPPSEKPADGPKITKNQETMFGILYDAHRAGMTVEEWYAEAREAGLGIRRKADLYDYREALRRRDLVYQHGGRWFAKRDVS